MVGDNFQKKISALLQRPAGTEPLTNKLKYVYIIVGMVGMVGIVGMVGMLEVVEMIGTIRTVGMDEMYVCNGWDG